MTVIHLLDRSQFIKPDNKSPEDWRVELSEAIPTDDAMLSALSRQVTNWPKGSEVGPFGETLVDCTQGYGNFDFSKEACFTCQVGKDCIAKTMGLTPAAIGLISKKRGSTRKRTSGTTAPKKKKVMYDPIPFSPSLATSYYLLFGTLLELCTSNPDYVRRRKVTTFKVSEIWNNSDKDIRDLTNLGLVLSGEDLNEEAYCPDGMKVWREVLSVTFSGDDLESVTLSPSLVRKTIKSIRDGKHKEG